METRQIHEGLRHAEISRSVADDNWQRNAQ
jgi:hypothetical protein